MIASHENSATLLNPCIPQDTEERPKGRIYRSRVVRVIFARREILHLNKCHRGDKAPPCIYPLRILSVALRASRIILA